MKQPWPMYVSRLKPRALTEEDQRLNRMLWSQRRGRILSGTALALSALLLGGVVWIWLGEDFLLWLTRP